MATGRTSFDNGITGSTQPTRDARLLGMVRPGWRMARGRDEDRLQARCEPPTLRDDSPFRLDGPAVESGAPLHPGAVPGVGDEAVAASWRLGLLTTGRLLGGLAGAVMDQPQALSLGLRDPRRGDLASPGVDDRGASDRGAALAVVELLGIVGTGRVLGISRVRRRLDGAAARGEPSPASRRCPERDLDRTGHGSGRPPECLRLPASDHTRTRTAGSAGGSLRRGPLDGPLDAAVPREHLHRPLAP